MRADDRGDAGGEIQQQRPLPRHAGLHQDGEVADAVRDLVRRHGEGRHEAQRLLLRKAAAIRTPSRALCSCRRSGPARPRRGRGRAHGRPAVSAATVVVVRVATVSACCGQSCAPDAPFSCACACHHSTSFSITKNTPESDDQRHANGMRAGSPGALHRLRQQRQQRRSQQCAGGEADKVRQDARALLFGHPQEHDGERSARDAAKCGAQHDLQEQRHGCQLCWAATGIDPSTQPPTGRGRSGKPDERCHASALPVAPVGKEPLRVGISAPLAARRPNPPRARCRRCRARAARSHCQRPRAFGTKAADAAASWLMKAARTSSPTSKCRGPIAGPIQAASAPGSSPSRATVASSTPAASPRQPACAAATAEPSAAANSTGMQSATWMTHTAPGRRAITASAGCRAASADPIELQDADAVDLLDPGRLGRQGARCAHTRRRFSPTASAASPTCAPMLSESYGAVLTPPVRSVNAACTRGGAGQCGLMTPIAPRDAGGSPAIRLERVQQALHVLRQRRLPLDACGRSADAAAAAARHAAPGA